MSKDPACLFYINDWLTSTAEMDADCRGWYLNLLLHNYDKGDLPNDIEKLAVLCNVKFSEYKRFEHVFEHLIKHKFEEIESGRISNLRTQSILKGREQFKEKRSNAGKASYLMRFFYEKFKKESKDKKLLFFVKDKLNLEIDTKNEQMIEHMFKHLFELYRNENENENENKDSNLSNESIELEVVENSKFGDGRLHFLCRNFYKENQTKYPASMYDEFMAYWVAIIENGKGKGKERWKSEKTFSLESRLNTWNNISNKNNNSKNGKSNSKEEYLRKTANELNDIFEIKERTGNYFGIEE